MLQKDRNSNNRSISRTDSQPLGVDRLHILLHSQRHPQIMRMVQTTKTIIGPEKLIPAGKTTRRVGIRITCDIMILYFLSCFD